MLTKAPSDVRSKRSPAAKPKRAPAARHSPAKKPLRPAAKPARRKPPGAKRRSSRIEARITPENLAVIKRAAEIQGRSVSDFIATAAQEAAHRTIEETHIIRVSVEDQRAIMEAILNPPEPTPALLRAFENHRRLFKQSDA